MVLRIIKSILEIQRFNSTRGLYHKMSKEAISHYENNWGPEISIDIRLKHKMQWYMAEFLYVGRQYEKLHGINTGRNDKNLMLAGALVTICDWIVDDIPIDDNELKSFKLDALKVIPESLKSAYTYLYNNLLNELRNVKNSIVLTYFDKLYQAQIRSKDQFDSGLTVKEIDSICRDKCGYSMLFIRALINDEITPDEEGALFELGGFIQFCNDTQDIHKDLNAGIRTFATSRSNWTEILKDLENQKTKTFNLIEMLDHPKKRKDSFQLSLRIMYSAIKAKVRIFNKMQKEELNLSLFANIEKLKIQKATKNWRLLPIMINQNFSKKR